MNRQEIQEALKAVCQILNVSRIAAVIRECSEGLKEQQFAENPETMKAEVPQTEA